jgi:moderate conductance mechanosensitive channel
MRSRCGIAAAAGGLAAVWTSVASARPAFGDEGTTGSFLALVTDRFGFSVSQIPALWTHLAQLPEIVGGRTALLLLGVVVAGLAAEAVVRLLLVRARSGAVERLVGQSHLKAFVRAILLDLVALVALVVAGRLVLGQIGDPQSVGGRLGHQLLQALLYWRVFNLLFRAWLRPLVPEERVAPVDDATARRLLVGFNCIIVLPLVAGEIARALPVTGASTAVTSAAIILYVPLIEAGLLAVVWHWRKDMAAWLSALVRPAGFSRKLKLDAARNWWMAGLAFYALMGAASVYATLVESPVAASGMRTIESSLMALLLFETLMHRITRHIVSELPMAGDVAADCLRLIARLYVAILIANALMVQVLAAATPAEWLPHDRGAKLAAVTAVSIYAFWRFLRYRMDSYIAANPLPSADATAEAEDEVRVAASRLRTLMPLLRAVSGVTVVIIGGLLVLSELGINITPLIAGASVLGLAISFGSQSIVRDIVSGVFFLAEDSFRIGEYIDCSKVKGVVEGFTVRSVRLRHQSGLLHIVPFSQVSHITNFSRDWTTIKFNLAFANGTDIELLRKTVKKIGLDMMEDPTFAKILMQPLKMQGVVDIKDTALIVRFKFTARPKNPSLLQRTAIRRMYEAFPGVGIKFAVPPYALQAQAAAAQAATEAAMPTKAAAE